jgi:hypothetical protein
MRLTLTEELHTLRILYRIETAELTLRGISKGNRHTTLRTGDTDLRLYAYKQFKYPVPNVIRRPTPSVVATPLLYLTLRNLRNGPIHVSLADTMQEQCSTAEELAHAKTDQARNGQRPLSGNGDDY